MDLSKFLEFTLETAYLAGRATLSYFHKGVTPEFKPDRTPVTAADRAAELLIRSRIEKAYPRHAVLGEEFGERSSAGQPFRWIIDPIDGTKAFLRGVPLYAVLIGLEVEGRVRVGAAYFPVLDEMISAAEGMGCWWNGKDARVSAISSLREGLVVYTDERSFERCGRADAWERIRKSAYQCSGWGDAYGYALVATGRAELMLDPVMNIWDCGPFPPILSEAGGFFGDWQGNPGINAGESIAASTTLLPEVLALIAGNGEQEGVPDSSEDQETILSGSKKTRRGSGSK